LHANEEDSRFSGEKDPAPTGLAKQRGFRAPSACGQLAEIADFSKWPGDEGEWIAKIGVLAE
jgi:hypothetical protein